MWVEKLWCIRALYSSVWRWEKWILWKTNFPSISLFLSFILLSFIPWTINLYFLLYIAFYFSPEWRQKKMGDKLLLKELLRIVYALLIQVCCLVCLENNCNFLSNFEIAEQQFLVSVFISWNCKIYQFLCYFLNRFNEWKKLNEFLIVSLDFISLTIFFVCVVLFIYLNCQFVFNENRRWENTYVHRHVPFRYCVQSYVPLYQQVNVVHRHWYRHWYQLLLVYRSYQLRPFLLLLPQTSHHCELMNYLLVFCLVFLRVFWKFVCFWIVWK